MVNPVRYLAALIFLAFASTVFAAEPAGCTGCHAGEVDDWNRSQHSAAMAPARPNHVSGDFSNITYSDGELKARFSREGDNYVIRTTETGQSKEWVVRYTFGVFPLQQYLIDAENGRLQAFNVAWDSRDAARGGQRWFRLDETGQNHPGDAMHWTGIYQNWNNQCAECHSTGLERSYDPQTDAYQTTWGHVAVSCTACHASAVEQAEARQHRKSHGAGIDLAAMGTWLVSEGKQPPIHHGPDSSACLLYTSPSPRD